MRPVKSDEMSTPGGRRSASALFFSVILLITLAAGCSRPAPKPVYFPGYPIGYVERGMASWYGPGFHGNKTANGERYDMHKLTAAHRTLPLGSIAVVRSARTGKEVTIRINDRGPFVSGRCLDLARGAFVTIASVSAGVINARYEVLK